MHLSCRFGRPDLAIIIETLVCTAAGPCISFPGGLAYPVFHLDVDAHCVILLTFVPTTGSLSCFEPASVDVRASGRGAILPRLRTTTERD